jgi:F0F1-type ATP synthase assembly protein I
VRAVRTRRRVLQMGLMVALALTVPLGIGLWLDRRAGSTPLFVLAGALVGILAATVSAVWVAVREITALGTPPGASSVTVESQEGNKEDTA